MVDTKSNATEKASSTFDSAKAEIPRAESQPPINFAFYDSDSEDSASSDSSRSGSPIRRPIDVFGRHICANCGDSDEGCELCDGGGTYVEAGQWDN